MGNSNTDPTPPDDIPEAVIQPINELQLPEMKSLISYIEQRIDALRTPLEDEIMANATGEVVDIEKHGSYTVVRKHPLNPDGDGVNTDITSLYHVRREQQFDATESLHWAYLGDVHNGALTRCEICGQTFDEDVDTCPHCGSDDIDNADSEE